MVASSFFRFLFRCCIALCVSLFFANTVWAQEDVCYAGVYTTRDDFVNNRLSYKINPKDKDYKLNFSFPADLTFTLRIVTPDTVYKFAPGTIYGYTDCGNVFRYFPGGKADVHQDFYKIEEATDDFVLYSSEFVSGNEIFYSRDLTSAIQRLTLRNLKKDFGNDPAFIAEIKKLKRRPDGLASSDEDGFLIIKLHQKRS